MADEPAAPAPAATPPASAPSSSAPAPSPSPAASPPATGSPAPTPSSPAPTTEWKRPSYAPDTVKSEAEAEAYFRDLTARDAAERSRKLTLPQKPEDYKLALSPSFKAPQGVEFVPNENDPVLPQARAFAQKHGLTQEAFSELVDLHAATKIGTDQSIKAAKAAELGKLGAAGQARMDAAATWLKAQVGEDLGKEFTTYLYTEKQVLAVEKLMSNFRTQGTGTYTPQHSEPPTDKGEIPGYENMTFAQKRFAQDQRAPRAAAR